MLLCMLLASSLFAQKKHPNEDVVYLQNGSVLRGEILDSIPAGNIRVRILGGSVLVYPMAEVARIASEPSNNFVRILAEKHVPKSRGFYHLPQAALLFGENQWGDLNIGFTLQHTSGYRFNRFLGVGLGLGLEQYVNGNSAAPVWSIPLYAEVRGHLLDRSFSPFYSVALGYGQPIGSGNAGSSSGGIYFNPAIGLRFPSTKLGHVTLDLGLKLQQLNRRDPQEWWGAPPFGAVERTLYKRWALRLGIAF